MRRLRRSNNHKANPIPTLQTHGRLKISVLTRGSFLRAIATSRVLGLIHARGHFPPHALEASHVPE